jgi:ubiquitin-activating enzyme E1 C
MEWPKIWGGMKWIEDVLSELYSDCNSLSLSLFSLCFTEQTKFDADNPDHMKWMYDVSLKRASEFNIKGVTYRLTQGVVKNIIPAIASTNAIIAGILITVLLFGRCLVSLLLSPFLLNLSPFLLVAAVCNEAFKISTDVANSLNNWMMYNGVTGTYTHTFEYEKKESCPVCGKSEFSFTISRSIKLSEFIESLKLDSRMQLKKPSLRMPGKSLYMQSPPVLEQTTRPNLEKTMGELLGIEDTLDITDPVLPNVAVSVKIKWSD